MKFFDFLHGFFKSFDRRRRFAVAGLLLITGALLGLGIWLLQMERNARIANDLEKELFAFQNEVNSALRNHQYLTEYMLGEVLAAGEDDFVERLMHRQMLVESEEERHRLRMELYERMTPLYGRMLEKGIRQLHFHTKNSESFLRMHRPDRFGDSLIGIRPTVEAANRRLEATQAFEEGRILNGFRYVHPLFYGEQHVGSVETSFLPEGVWRYMKRVNPDRDYQFMIRESVVRSTVFDDLIGDYTMSELSANYMVEDNDWVRSEKIMEEVENGLRDIVLRESRRLLQTKTAEKEPWGYSIRAGDHSYILMGYPVENLAGDPVALMVSLTRDDGFSRIQSRFASFRRWVYGGAAFFFLTACAGIFFIFHLQDEKRGVQERLTVVAGQLPGMV
ncbi:MAG: hypothetical protein JJU05_17360, partial [Verrucomicrobia bacterium]|nr:hypothetical protein [Verrucomicrobiota bacterium]